MLIVFAAMVAGTLPIANHVFAQSQTGSNATASDEYQSQMEQLNKTMAEVESSDNPKDIATLAYIWGFPLISQVRLVEYSTSPNVPPAPGRGPINTFNDFESFPTSNYTDIIRINADTLYSLGYLDLQKEPLVIQIPPISGRYYTTQFTDAYLNNFYYIGTRLNDTTGGTYLISGPNWKGEVPADMKEIKSPTNISTIGFRIFVSGPSDVPNVTPIQDKLVLTPISVFGQNTTSQSMVTTETNDSTQVPIGTKPALIPTTGIKIFNEISKDMAYNQPPESDSKVLAKFATIGIGPGLKPSDTKNETIRAALENGITEGQKLIDSKVQVIGNKVNGWKVNLNYGNYGTDYLLRAAVTKSGGAAHNAEEAIYPTNNEDNRGQPLTGANKYSIHFDKGQTPPVDQFWSITMYDIDGYLVDNPLNRYSISSQNEGLKHNPDGSLDIYLQHESPGTEKESNWIPSPTGEFSLSLRMYGPQEPMLNGEYQIPAVQIMS